MSVRYFCDVCANEIGDTGRIMRKLGDVMVEVMVRYKNTWNGGGHVCHPCVIKVITEGQIAYRNECYAAHMATEQEQRASWLTSMPQNTVAHQMHPGNLGKNWDGSPADQTFTSE